MFLDHARGFADSDLVAQRGAMLETAEAVRPLLEWSAGLVARRQAKEPDVLVPFFDPADAGVEAKLLVLLEAPGPMTNNRGDRPGSGFISVDNNDPTAENLWNLRREFGLDSDVLLWNIVPWYLGPTSVHPNAEQIAQGSLELRRLIALLPELTTVLTCGVPATKGWQRHIAPHADQDLTVIETWHPSPLAMAAPGKREGLRKAFERAARLAG